MNCYYLDATQYVLEFLDDQTGNLSLRERDLVIARNPVLTYLPVKGSVRLETMGYVLIVAPTSYEELFQVALTHGMRLLDFTAANCRRLNEQYVPFSHNHIHLWYDHLIIQSNLNASIVSPSRP